MKAFARRLRRLFSPALRRPDLLRPDTAEAGIDLLYRFLLARPPDDAGRRHYADMRAEGATLRQIAAEIAASDEFHRRLKDSVAVRSLDHQDSAATSTAPLPVDAQQVAATFSVEALARTADDYYRQTLEFGERYLAKPFDSPHDAPDLLGSFGQLLAGLRLVRGMDVLDFGAGVCWTTRCLTQLGCAAIALDVSPTALELGRRIYARLPPIGDCPAPRFLVFDGHRIDLPDESVDRIICFDAFHHVPNPGEVMRELGRLLRPGGIAGFSEPGPRHSAASRSQYEMKNYVAFENDVVMSEVWQWARAAGFTGIELAIFTTESHRVSLADFNDVVAGGPALRVYDEKLRAFLGSHQTFFLTKAGRVSRDSREREGLRAEITIVLERAEVLHGELIRGRATVQNVGTAVWLPGSTPLGGVNLGVHLRTRDGRPIAVDYARVALDETTPPGEMRAVEFALRPPPPGQYLFEFDAVSEGVSWFEMNGSPTVTRAITVT